MEKTARMALLTMQAVAIMLALALVIVTYATPDKVERQVQGLALVAVEDATATAWRQNAGLLGTGGRLDRLGDAARRLVTGAARANADRDAVIAALVVQSLAGQCEAEGCARLVARADGADVALVARVGGLDVGAVTLNDHIAGRYTKVVDGLLGDLRRFGIVTAVALGLMMALVLVGRGVSRRFIALSVAVTGYTFWAAWGYVFGQDWAAAVVFGDWAAPAYQAGLIIMSCVFIDWLFLDGFFTNAILAILNGFFAAISSVFPS